VRYRSARRIRLVLSDYPEGLLAAVIANDRDGVTEASDGVIPLLRHHHRLGAACFPVAKVSTRTGKPVPIAVHVRHGIGFLGGL
jgi:hypothetical protein